MSFLLLLEKQNVKDKKNKRVKNAVKAIIIKDGKIAVIQKAEDNKIYYTLPGGSQKKFEDMESALKRECMEEIDCEINIKTLLFIREYIGKNHEFKTRDADIHKVEFFFLCEIKESEKIKNGIKPDKTQIDVLFIEIEKLEKYNFYPKGIIEKIKYVKMNKNIYLGDIN